MTQNTVKQYHTPVGTLVEFEPDNDPWFSSLKSSVQTEILARAEIVKDQLGIVMMFDSDTDGPVLVHEADGRYIEGWISHHDVNIRSFDEDAQDIGLSDGFSDNDFRERDFATFKEYLEAVKVRFDQHAHQSLIVEVAA